MTREVAQGLIEEKLKELRKLSYGVLLNLRDRTVTSSVKATDGKEYQLEIQAFWDSKKGGNLRVMASVSWSGLSDFIPLNDSFIITPDGMFIGET